MLLPVAWIERILRNGKDYGFSIKKMKVTVDNSKQFITERQKIFDELGIK